MISPPHQSTTLLTLLMLFCQHDLFALIPLKARNYEILDVTPKFYEIFLDEDDEASKHTIHSSLDHN